MKQFLAGALGLLLAGTLCVHAHALGTQAAQAQQAAHAPSAQAGATHAGPALAAAPAQYPDLDPSLSVSVRFDYDDKIRVNFAVPAFIEITNSGPATDVVARVHLDQNVSTAYDLAVHLEQNASTGVVIPFYALQRQERVEVKLLRDGKTVAVADPNRATGRGYIDDKLAGILSANPEGMTAWHQNLTALSGDSPTGGTAVTTVEMTARDFPDDAALLDRFALLILNHYDLSLLDDLQQAALVRWVRGGGRLLVDGDVAGARALQSLRDVVALEPAGSLSAGDAVEQLGALTGRSYTWEGGLQGLGKVTPAGTVVAGSTSTPLIMRHEAGAGRVFVTAFALDDPFFQQTRAAEIFSEISGLSAWSESTSSYSYGYGSDHTATSAMFDAAASISWLDAPALGWVVLVLLAFIVLAGPVNYIVLKKLDKRDWLWVTTPGLAVIFCVLVMSLGTGRNQTVTSTITVVDSRAGTGSARAYTLVGLGAARQGGYAVAPGEAGIPYQTQTYNYTNSYNNAATGQTTPITDPALVFEGNGPGAAFQNIPQWNMDSYMLRRENPAQGRLEAQVHYAADGTVRYTVKNGTGAALEDVTLLSHLGYCNFLLLEDGEEQSGELIPYGTSFSGGAYLMNGAGYSDLMWAYRDANPLTPANEDEQREAYLRSSLVNALVGSVGFPGTGTSTSYTLPDSALLWGWSAELGSLPLTVNGKTVKNELNRTMVLSSAGITYDGLAQLAVPVASAEGWISDMQNVVNTYSTIGEGAAMFSGGEVTFSFDLPGIVTHYTVENLVIFASYEWGSYEAALYNNATGSWDLYTIGTELSGELDAYLDEYGTILLKITDLTDPADQSTESILFEYPTVNIAGKERSNGDG